jgi:hypothetical protein
MRNSFENTVRLCGPLLIHQHAQTGLVLLEVVHLAFGKVYLLIPTSFWAVPHTVRREHRIILLRSKASWGNKVPNLSHLKMVRNVSPRGKHKNDETISQQITKRTPQVMQTFPTRGTRRSHGMLTRK